MYKKAIFFLVLSQSCMADICPSVKDIKHLSVNSGWKIYDSESGARISSKRFSQFKKLAQQFVLAEWPRDKANTIHCYYRDKNGSDLEAYVAKPHFIPKIESQYWYEVSGFMHCAADSSKCEFDKSNLKHLASK